MAKLIQATDGKLYGTTRGDGNNTAGTVFRINPDGSSFAVLHTFSTLPTDGMEPYGALIQGADGNLYGTTSSGGAQGAGTVFRLTLAGAFTLVHSFSGGYASPYAEVVQGPDGNLYGTTIFDPAGRFGSVFQLSPDGSVFNTLHTFSSIPNDGALPKAALLLASDGNFYGTTQVGGTNNGGTVFRISPTGNYALLHSFDGLEGPETDSEAALVQATTGDLWGMTGNTVYKLSAFNNPIILSIPSGVPAKTPFTLTYAVANAYSQTLQQCLSANSASSAQWTGPKSGSPTATSVTLTAPSVPGMYTYSLTCGGIESSQVNLVVLPPAPAITKISPNNGPLAGGTTVTIRGNNFLGVTGVSIAGNWTGNFTVNSATSITLQTPPGNVAGTFYLGIAGPGGFDTATSASQFTYKQ